MDVRPGRKAALVAVCLCLIGQHAWADDAEPDEGPLPEPNWIPSIEVGFDIFKYETDSNVVDHATEPRMVGPANWGGDDIAKTTEVVARLGGELMGPAIESIPGQPRFFIQGGLHWTTFQKDELLKIGVVGSPETAVNGINQFRKQRELFLAPFPDGRDCDNRPAINCPERDAGAFPEQGSLIDGEFKNPGWYAGVGVAFHVPVGDELMLQIKPSAAYTMEEVTLTGKLTTVNEIFPPLPAPPEDLEHFVVVRGSGKQTTIDHSLGVGLELGLVLFKDVRPVRTTLFVNGRVMWLLGDRTTRFSDSEGAGTYSVRRDTVTIRGGAGVRFSWMGFGGG